MIIACPDCSGPYQLPDDQIAPLVQVECPHCTYRIILDFAAANDSSLVEAGMQMASGYASEADYRAAAGGAPAARATPAAQPAAQPRTPSPRPAAPTSQPATAPPSARPSAPASAGPVRSRVPSGARAPDAATGDSASSDTGRTILGQPPISIPPAPPEHRAQTPVPLELTQKIEEQKAAAEARASEVIELTDRTPEPEPEPEPVEVEGEVDEAEAFEPAPEAEEIAEEVAEAPIEAPAEDAQAESRRPPHTPPAKAASTPPPAGDEELEIPETPSPAELSAAGMESEDFEEEPRSHAVLYLLIGLLLVGGALVGFSFYDTGDPNPMPLIEELIRSYTG